MRFKTDSPFVLEERTKQRVEDSFIKSSTEALTTPSKRESGMLDRKAVLPFKKSD